MMRRNSSALAAGLALFYIPAFGAPAGEPAPAGQTNRVLIQSAPGDNGWNAGHAPADWWGEIRRQHGHVGPWNILGWRMGRAALREFKTEWGRHDLEVICYLPPQTPFTCLVDGVAVGTGNSLGRLDLKLAEVFDTRQSFVAIRRKDATGPVLELHPRVGYLQAILNRPLEKLESLSRECAELPEPGLFELRWIAK
jgi:formylmethanofuran dehydrogenase subunit E